MLETYIKINIYASSVCTVLINIKESRWPSQMDLSTSMSSWSCQGLPLSPIGLLGYGRYGEIELTFGKFKHWFGTLVFRQWWKFVSLFEKTYVANSMCWTRIPRSIGNNLSSWGRPRLLPTLPHSVLSANSPEPGLLCRICGWNMSNGNHKAQHN